MLWIFLVVLCLVLVYCLFLSECSGVVLVEVLE